MIEPGNALRTSSARRGSLGSRANRQFGESPAFNQFVTLACCHALELLRRTARPFNDHPVDARELAGPHVDTPRALALEAVAGTRLAIEQAGRRKEAHPRADGIPVAPHPLE